MNKKRFLLMIIVIFSIILTFAACRTDNRKTIMSGDITENNIEQICEMINEAGLSNTDIFRKWVRDYCSGRSSDKENTSGFSDPDCRMTAMLLAGEAIKSESVLKRYKGTYLMFDIDAIENNAEYSILKDKEDLFTTIFGEMPITGSGFDKSYVDRWQKYGIRVESEKFSLISILFKTFEQEEAFVGHTGILIDCRESEIVDAEYLFIEKIAFSDPFRITCINDPSELIDVFSKRSDYKMEKGEPVPVVYRNGEKIGTLKQ